MKNILFTIGVLIFSLSHGQNNGGDHTDILTNEFPSAKTEIKSVLDGIEQSIRDNDMDRLIAFHAYGPKFTEFKNGERRTGSLENEKFEREFLGSFTDVEKWELDDLKIAVYGDVANVTFHADFVPIIKEEKLHMTGQFTLLFVKTSEGWKIVHEHMSPLKQE